MTTTLLLLSAALLSSQGASSLRCFICDTTSAQSYADANDQCNIHNQQECADPRATACMLEGYMKPNNVAQVVKRCVSKCPVFINTTAEVVRCCPKDGCNGELNHRPPPHIDLGMLRERGRFPPFPPHNMDGDGGRDGGHDGGPPDMGRRGMGPGQGGMRPDHPGPRPDGGDMPPMPPRGDPDMPHPEPDMPHQPDRENNMVEQGDRRMKRPRGHMKDMDKGPKDGDARKKNAPASRSGMTDEQMGSGRDAAGNLIPSFLCILTAVIVSSRNW